MPDQRRGRLQLGLDHLAGAGVAQPVDGVGVVSASEDRDVGIELAEVTDGEMHAFSLGQGDDGERGVGGPGRFESGAMRGVAEEAGDPAGPQALDDVGIGLDRHVRSIERLERLGDGAAHAPEAADDHVIAEAVAGLGGERLCRAREPDAPDPAGDDTDERGVDQDRDERGGERRVVDVGGDVPGVAGDQDEDERELADLGKPHADHEGRR